MVTSAVTGELDSEITENLDKLLGENNPAAMTSLLQAIDALLGQDVYIKPSFTGALM